MELFKKPKRDIIAYTAGALEGDGCICINRRANRYSVRISQGENNKGKEWCDWFAKQWGMGFVQGDKTIRRGHWGNTIIWNWHVARLNQAEFLLNCLLPYLFVKRAK